MDALETSELMRLPRVGSEAHVANNVAQFLVEEGYIVWMEVPNLGQSADLVARMDAELTFVEVKRQDWRRALRQCRAHHMVADFICIAISQVRISEKLIAEVQRLGYGLIHFVPAKMTCCWAVKPNRLQDFWEPERSRLVERIKSIPQYA